MRERDKDWVNSLTPEHVRAELDARQISTKNAVSHVLAMVREAKRTHKQRLQERN
jgi:hypothetical protein